MKISGRRDYLINLESVAMTDIILNMFIFFFISFSLLYTFSPERIQKLDVKLPEAANTAPLEDKGQVNIVLTGDDAIYLDKERVSMSGLKDALSARRKDNPKLTVILRADKSVRFKQIVTVIDMLTELKVSRLSIAAVNGQK
jgi:biopolymer transport protein ExbD